MRVQVHVVGVGPPQARLHAERNIGVSEQLSIAATELVVPVGTERAIVTGDEGLNDNPVTHINTPAPGRTVADLLDHTEGFMAGDEGERHGQDPAVLLGIAATDTAGLDP